MRKDDWSLLRKHTLKIKKTNSFNIVAAITLVLLSFSIIISDNNAAFATSHNLSVSTEDDVGNPLTDYWVVVKQNGVIVNSGFSTAEFTLSPGDYQVAVGDYGGLFFNQWSGGPSTREVSITITSTNTISLSAIYSTIPYGTVLGPSIEVDSSYSSGAALSGIYVQLLENGVVIEEGFTPVAFPVTEGQSYTVIAGDYTDSFFNHWDSGEIFRTITLTATASTTQLKAIYTTTPQLPPIAGSSIDVISTYSDGSPLTGINVQLLQNGIVVDEGFTPIAFPVTEGQSYTVTAGDYTNAFFNHWQSGLVPRTITVTATASATQLEAIYTTTPQPPPPGQIGPNSVTIETQLLDGTPTTNLYIQIRLDGSLLSDGFSPVTFSNLQAGQEYQIVAYWFGEDHFRHYSDGVLTRYHYVTPGPDPITLTAVYESIPDSQEDKLNVTAIDEFGNIIGDTTGNAENGTLAVTPGMWMAVIPPGQTTPFTGGYTGSSSEPFSLVNGQTYEIQMNSYQQYQFGFWQDNGSTDPIRAFTMNGDSLNNIAIYNIIS